MASHSETKLRSKGQVTIPSAARKAMNLQEGDPIAVEVVEEGILLKPRKVIDPQQGWFWTKTWQQGEAEAEADLSRACLQRFDNTDDFIEHLDEATSQQSSQNS